MTYTPSAEEVEMWYAIAHDCDCAVRNGEDRGQVEEFRRFLAAEEARIRADERRRIAEAIRAEQKRLNRVSDDGMEIAARIAEEPLKSELE